MKNFNRYDDGNKVRQNQEDDIKLVKEYASKLGLTLIRFQTNDVLELYFDICQYVDEKSMCYISKGWDDPGYRIGECVTIDKDTLDFKEKFYKILNICSDNLIAVKVTLLKDNKVELNLQIGIYQDGFNEKVLHETLDALGDSLQRIRVLLGH